MAAQTHCAVAQTLGRGADDDVSVWRIVGALAICVSLAAAGALILKFRTGGQPDFSRLLAKRARRLRIVESLRLGRQVTLSIVQCDERELLLLSSDTAGQVIETHAAPPGAGES